MIPCEFKETYHRQQISAVTGYGVLVLFETAVRKCVRWGDGDVAYLGCIGSQWKTLQAHATRKKFPESGDRVAEIPFRG